MGSEREQCRSLSSGRLSVTSPTTHQQIGPFWCWFPGGWVCVHSRAPWFSPVNSPVRLGVYPAPETPTDFYSQRFWGSLFPCWNPGLCNLSCFPVIVPGLSAYKCGTAFSSSHCLAVPVLQPPPHWLGPPAATVLQLLPCCASSLPQLPISTPPASLDECFFFNSLVVGLPYSLIFWQFWLFFCF